MQTKRLYARHEGYSITTTWKAVPAQSESAWGGVAKGPGQAGGAQREGLCSPISWANQTSPRGLGSGDTLENKS